MSQFMSQFHHRIMVTGSRDWTDDLLITVGLLSAVYHCSWDGADGYATGETFTLVSGNCPTGADAIAERLAWNRGWNVERHPADWDKHGKAAGPLRNAEMVNSGIELVIAFQKNNSRGTQNAIDLARAAKIPVFLWSE